MKIRTHRPILISVLLSFVFCSLKANVELISYRSWKYCYRISNASTELVINPEFGGHIIYYGLKSRKANALWADTTLNGYTIERYIKDGKNRIDPDAGRFDIGNEIKTDPVHDTLWVGPYSVRIINDYSLSVTSMPSLKAGIQIIRVYTLDRGSSYLLITQTMKNLSNSLVTYCHWTRTLLPLGGIYFTQFVKTDKYPQGMAQWGWRRGRDDKENPLASGITLLNDSLFVARPGGNQSVKIAIMTTSGWCAYLNSNVMFVKRFDYCPDGDYNYNPGYSFPNAIYYDSRFIEIEPNSPMTTIKPGESSSYNESWWLIDYNEATDNSFNILKAARFAEKNAIIKN